jgi:hypothetical protein
MERFLYIKKAKKKKIKKKRRTCGLALKRSLRIVTMRDLEVATVSRLREMRKISIFTYKNQCFYI